MASPSAGVDMMTWQLQQNPWSQDLLSGPSSDQIDQGGKKQNMNLHWQVVTWQQFGRGCCVWPNNLGKGYSNGITCKGFSVLPIVWSVLYYICFRKSTIVCILLFMYVLPLLIMAPSLRSKTIIFQYHCTSRVVFNRLSTICNLHSRNNTWWYLCMHTIT